MVRFKHRYMAYLIVTDTPSGHPPTAYHPGAIVKHLREAVQACFGLYGWGAVMRNLQVKYFNPQTNVCIIRVARDHHELTWEAISTIRKLQGQPVEFRTLRLAATIQQCHDGIQRYHRRVLAALRRLIVQNQPKAALAKPPPRKPPGIVAAAAAAVADDEEKEEEAAAVANADGMEGIEELSETELRHWKSVGLTFRKLLASGHLHCPPGQQQPAHPPPQRARNPVAGNQAVTAEELQHLRALLEQEAISIEMLPH